jgi:mono/diheme cytochrome c family protein
VVSNNGELHPSEFTGDARNADQGYLMLVVLVLLLLGGALTFIIVLPSWRPTHNMERQPYHRPYDPSGAFADKMSERPLVSGVVPRSPDQSPGIPYVAVRSAGPADYPVLAPSATIPVAVTRQFLERGQERFNIYCAVCHGRLGDGDGMIVHRGFYPPPSFHIPRLRQEPDSHFFNVITNGYGTMFSYSDRVAPNDRWAIVAYIRALQMGAAAKPDLQAKLQKEKGVRP